VLLSVLLPHAGSSPLLVVARRDGKNR
jgi:hypothetical protein